MRSSAGSEASHGWLGFGDCRWHDVTLSLKKSYRKISRGPLAERSRLTRRPTDCRCGECSECIQRRNARQRIGLGQRKSLPKTAFEVWSQERQKVWFDSPCN